MLVTRVVSMEVCLKGPFGDGKFLPRLDWNVPQPRAGPLFLGVFAQVPAKKRRTPSGQCEHRPL